MSTPRETVESQPLGATSQPKLARRLGLFDTTMIVMGGIIGSGIFMNPYVVARQVHTPALILAAWAVGGVIALAGAFVYAELAAERPEVGGQYAYLREAYHPAIAFIYGWSLLLVIQSGGMAAVAITFARYFVEITRAPIPEWTVAALALGALTIINCLGVRAGSTVQNVLMVIKILAIAALIICGLLVSAQPTISQPQAEAKEPVVFNWQLITAFGAALAPVLFAYGGWQTASFIAGEVREPRKNLPRGLLLGVACVILLYLAVNVACIHALGADGLAKTATPASEVMSIALGERGRAIIAAGIAISTLGFLSQGMLTAPRVYFAMAEDKLFFRSVAWLHPKTRVPVVAIALQGAMATLIAISGKYEQILNYVVSVDFIFFGLTAICIFIFRRRDKQQALASDSPAPTGSLSTGSLSTARSHAMPGHPLTTVFFVAACWVVVLNTVYKYPANSAIGMGIMLIGIPVYFFWRGRRTIR